MGVTIQIRNVPEDLHRRLKSRAAHAGLSLCDYLLGEVSLIAEQPTLAEMLKRLASDPPTALSESCVEAVRRERDAIKTI